MKEIFLYGAGGYGRTVLDYFLCHNALDMISLIIDNNPGLKNAVILGKPILPYDSAVDRINSDVTVIISVELETALSISKQLKNDGIIRYLFWACEQNISFGELLELVNMDDYEIYSHSLLQEINIIDRQKQYLLNNCNPKYFKPAQGELRTRQLQFAYEIVSEWKCIHPFITSGNLLGYVRHDGFIPWDDDFDLTIIRSEYDLFRDMLIEKYYYNRYNGPFNDDKEQLKWIKHEMDHHQGNIIVLERPMLLRICKKTMNGEYLLVDFFPFDEFKDESLYDQRLDVLQKNKKLLAAVRTVEEYYAVIQKIASDDIVFREVGGLFMGYGYDVRESYSSSKYRGFIKRSDVFPLKKIKFEGYDFEAPKNPVAFLKYEFGEDYMKLPQSIGLHFSTGIFNREELN